MCLTAHAGVDEVAHGLQPLRESCECFFHVDGVAARIDDCMLHWSGAKLAKDADAFRIGYRPFAGDGVVPTR